MISDYYPLFIILFLAVFVGFFVVGLGHSFGPHRPSAKKMMPYESGMIPYGEGRRKVAVRYYLIAVLFILFDIEIVFVLPWAIVFREVGFPGFWLMVVFLAILEVAFVYAWKKGALEWD
jgi:NADH-quinone oxidoreductase subunit A